jgi:hypothetical protein
MHAAEYCNGLSHTDDDDLNTATGMKAAIQKANSDITTL